MLSARRVKMKYRLLDLLACPICKTFPLELYVIEEKTYDRRMEFDKIPYCEEYCGFLRVSIKEVDNTPCEECFKKEVVTGALYCVKCGRWYPIIDEIPRMLPDDLRDKRAELEFLEKHRGKLPDKIVYEGKPFRLTKSS